MTVYRASILTAAAAQTALTFLPDGRLEVDDAGVIASVRGFDPGDHADVHLAGHLITPGFVDAHLHYPQTRIVGSASGPLLDWLTTSVFPEEGRFTEQAYAANVATAFCDRALSSGTTTLCAFSSSSPVATECLFQTLSDRGLRGLAGLTLMDAGCPDDLVLPVKQAMAACEQLIDRWHGADAGRLRFAITPRFALSCTKQMLSEAGKLSQRHGLFVQTHVSENVDEGTETLKQHPYAKDYLDVYDQAGLLHERTLLAHAIHLSDREWDRVADRGARVIHCPDSNFFLGSGRMPLGAAERRTVTVGLGSDVAAGRTFDMRRIAASAYDNALCLDQPVTPAHLFRLATLGGAAALDLDAVAGSLERGKQADFVVSTLPAYLTEGSGGEATQVDRVLGHLLFASETMPVRQVFVGGKRCYDRAS